MELFAAELRIPEVRTTFTRGLISATWAGISGEHHVIMACRDIPTGVVKLCFTARVSYWGSASVKKEESKRRSRWRR
jgi:hypothetical protein